MSSGRPNPKAPAPTVSRGWPATRLKTTSTSITSRNEVALHGEAAVQSWVALPGGIEPK
jgi:hypothetical protein